MPGRLWQRLLMGVLGAATATAAGLTGWLLFFAPRFDAAGLTINSKARINPERTYELVVWDEAIIVPWAPRSQQDVLAEAVAEFQQRWPNVRISYSVLEPEEARGQLAAAVAAGRPPDVYGTARGLVLHPSHQIPAEPYFPAARRGEPPVFHPAAVAGLSRGGTAWGWPRALWWETWLAEATALERGGLHAERVIIQGWTWDAVLAFAQQATFAEDPLVLDTVSLATLMHLVLNSGATGAPRPDNPLGWTEEALLRAGRFLEELRRQAALPLVPEEAARTRVERILSGRTAVIGPVGPHLAQAVMQRKPGSYLLVPVPHHAQATEVAPMEPGGYFVFRQDPYQGDDHTRLAMELAAWLAARTESWVAESLGLVPARTATLHAWHGVAPLDEHSRTLLIDYLQQAPVRDAPLSVELDALTERVAPHWRDFWDQNLSHEELAARVWQAIQQASQAPHGADSVRP